MFRKHMQRKHSARMTTVPRLDIPDIFVDDDLSFDEGAGGAPRSPLSDGGQSPSRSWFGSVDMSPSDTAWQHPLSFPRSSPSSPTAHHGATPSAFSFELQEPDEEGMHQPPQPASGQSSRRGSALAPMSPVSPVQVRDMLDDSVWVESIRRSATLRRSQTRGSQRYGQ